MPEIKIVFPSPPEHRPVEVCATCRQPWPCEGEKAIAGARGAAREAVQRALAAATSTGREIK